jgi:uncharacterized membrane protein YgcG
MIRLLTLILVIVALVVPAVPALAGDVYVRGHTRSDGTYVQPHWRSAPDGNRFNNWSTQGNVNPYTGKSGTRDPYSSGSGSSIFGGNGYGGSGYGSGLGNSGSGRSRSRW